MYIESNDSGVPTQNGSHSGVQRQQNLNVESDTLNQLYKVRDLAQRGVMKN